MANDLYDLIFEIIVGKLKVKTSDMPKGACRWFYFWSAIAGATEILAEKVSLDTLLDKVGMEKKKHRGRF